MANNYNRKVSSVIALLLILAVVSVDLRWPVDAVNFGNISLLLGLGVCFILTLFKNLFEHEFKFSLLPVDLFLLLYISFCFISSIWSVDLFATLFHSLLLLLFFVLTVFVTSNVSLEDLVRSTIYICSFVCLASIALFLLGIPGALEVEYFAERSELRGVMNHHLRLGIVSNVGLGLLLISYFNVPDPYLRFGKLVFFCFALLFISCLWLSNTRLYGAFGFLAVIFVFVVDRGILFRRFNFSFAIVLLFIFGFYWITIIEYLEAIGFDTTLTSRTFIWKRTLDLFIFGLSDWDTFFGYGYASFDNHQFDWIFPSYRSSHPHSSFLQSLFETGYIGFFLIWTVAFWHLLICYRRAITMHSSYSLFMVVFSLLGGLTGGVYASKLSILFMITFVIFSAEARRR